MAFWINIYGCQSCARMTICVVNQLKTIAIVRDCMYVEIRNFEFFVHFCRGACLNLPEPMSDFLHSYQFGQFLHLTYFSAKYQSQTDPTYDP